MALVGKLDVEVELKSSSDKYWQGIVDSNNLFPKIFPEQYKKIEVIQGDGKSAGSIRKIDYGEGVPSVTSVKERVELMDETNKAISYKLIEGDLLNFFNNFKASLQLLPKGDGSTVKWCVEYEKMNEEVPEPKLLADIAAKTFSDFDEYLLKN